MPRPFRVRNSPLNFGALIASFLVIAAGLSASIIISISSTNNPALAIVICVVFFSFVAMIPLSTLRPPKQPGDRRPSPGLLAGIRNWLRKPPEKKPSTTTWKRKRTSFQHTPPGHDYLSTFVPEQKSESTK